MESEVDSFTVELVIRGYHVYEEVWSSVIGEVLVCRRDTRNRHDPFAVATCKDTTQWRPPVTSAFSQTCYKCWKLKKRN